MSIISRIAGAVMPQAAEVVAKCTGKALSVTKNVFGIPVTTYLKTGTQVARNVEGMGAKTVILGGGNKLSQVLSKGTALTCYPKGTFFGGETGMIIVSGNKAAKGLPLEPKEFGEFIQMLKEMKKAAI